MYDKLEEEIKFARHAVATSKLLNESIFLTWRKSDWMFLIETI